MNKSDVLRITEQYNLAPNKKLGQNFLISDSLIEKIVNSCGAEGKRVLEIGPGLGAVSAGLSSLASEYTAVEIDSGFFRYLSDFFSSKSNITLIHADFLKASINDEFDLIVSNLPYYCASEILFKIASDFTAPEIYVMVQKEMGDRMAAACGSSNYGAMSVTLAYYFDIRLLFHVPGESFYPRPDVKSSFLQLSRKQRELGRQGEKLFHLLVKSAFWGRRKTLLKALSASPHGAFDKKTIQHVLDQCGIEAARRGEELTLDEYIKLTEELKKYEK